MNLWNFLEKFSGTRQKRREIGAVCPSSPILAKDMVTREEIQNSETIVELWAGTGVFTERIFSLIKEGQKVIIVEKDEMFFEILQEKFPQYKKDIYNIDVQELWSILEEKGIDKVDLFISGLPFRSLPKKLFVNVMLMIRKFSHKNTKFKQFSYAPNVDHYKKYFASVLTATCIRNIPPAFIFTCSGVREKTERII